MDDMTTPPNTSHYQQRLDDAVRPQDDFFGYVNNKWIASNPIPPSETRWGAFMILRDAAWQNMRTIYEGLDANQSAMGTIEQQARDLYFTGMHYDELETEHVACVADYMQQ